MKMIKMIVIGLAALATTSVASAVELTSGPNEFTMVDCALLSNDIRLILTGGVVGGVVCDDANNLIGLSLCHTAGLTSERSTKYNNGDVMQGGTCAETTQGAGCIETVTGAAFPSANTGQGTVASRFPGDECTAPLADAEAAVVITDAIAAGY